MTTPRRLGACTRAESNANCPLPGLEVEDPRLVLDWNFSGQHGGVILDDGELQRRVPPDPSQAIPGAYTQVRAGAGRSCALSPARGWRCWGPGVGDRFVSSPPPEAQVMDLDEALCFVVPGTQEVRCDPRDKHLLVPDTWRPEVGEIVELSLSGPTLCALGAGGEVACVGSAAGEAFSARPGPWSAVDAFEDLVCGVRPGGRVECARLAGDPPPVETGLEQVLRLDLYGRGGFVADAQEARFFELPPADPGPLQDLALGGARPASGGRPEQLAYGEPLVVAGYARSGPRGAELVRHVPLARCEGASAWDETLEDQWLVLRGTPRPDPGCEARGDCARVQLQGCEVLGGLRPEDIEPRHQALMDQWSWFLGLRLAVSGHVHHFRDQAWLMYRGRRLQLIGCEFGGVDQDAWVSGFLGYLPAAASRESLAVTRGLVSWDLEGQLTLEGCERIPPPDVPEGPGPDVLPSR
ncbi:MAG: hypothetical protein H6741_24935 [Alphaproteobacteria bacterium]|nr:hypothetical protein [Alphaproteobacteria bacterium]